LTVVGGLFFALSISFGVVSTRLADFYSARFRISSLAKLSLSLSWQAEEIIKKKRKRKIFSFSLRVGGIRGQYNMEQTDISLFLDSLSKKIKENKIYIKVLD
jgi:hypothetical protein